MRADTLHSVIQSASEDTEILVYGKGNVLFTIFDEEKNTLTIHAAKKGNLFTRWFK